MHTKKQMGYINHFGRNQWTKWLCFTWVVRLIFQFEAAISWMILPVLPFLKPRLHTHLALVGGNPINSLMKTYNLGILWNNLWGSPHVDNAPKPHLSGRGGRYGRAVSVMPPVSLVAGSIPDTARYIRTYTHYAHTYIHAYIHVHSIT